MLERRSGRMAQSVKLLPSNHEDLLEVPSTHKKNWVCRHSTREEESGGAQGMLATKFSLIGKLQFYDGD